MGNYEGKQEVTDKYSLRGRVFHKRREDILSGKYEEHEELKEVAIGEEMGVSRTPVREAFRQLELEGLIQIIPNKGAYVTGITALFARKEDAQKVIDNPNFREILNTIYKNL